MTTGFTCPSASLYVSLRLTVQGSIRPLSSTIATIYSINFIVSTLIFSCGCVLFAITEQITVGGRVTFSRYFKMHKVKVQNQIELIK